MQKFKPEFKLNYTDISETCSDLNIVQSASEGELGESRIFKYEWIHKLIIK